MAGKKIGWIGMGRMGYPMAERLVRGGNDVYVWNRTRSKAEPLADLGATLVDSPSDLGECDIVFTMVSTGADVEQVYFGENGVLSGDATPAIFVDCSSIGTEQSADIRRESSPHLKKYLHRYQAGEHQSRCQFSSSIASYCLLNS